MNIQDIKDLLRAMAVTDLSAMPTPRFKAFMREALIKSHGFTPESAETLVARMEVTLGNDPIADEHLRDMAGSYATVVHNLREVYLSLGFSNPTRAVVEQAAQLSLKFN